MEDQRHVRLAVVVAALNRMANVEMRMARKADPHDEVTVVEMHNHAERCLREAAKAIEGLAGE